MNILDIYHQYPIALTEGKGIELTDSEGKNYKDFYGGHGVISIGHSHPDFVQSITKQLELFAFYSNAFKNPLQEQLVKLLGELSGYEGYGLFLSNSGAEANENALKAASFINGRKKALAIKGAFHGRSAGAVALTDNKNIQPKFGSDIQVDFISINDIEALNATLSTHEYCALIIEGIQGVNGVYEADTQFWETARMLCKHTSTVLIADEVQSGYGRSGKFFAHQYHNVTADIVTVGKGMGNGFPVAATIISPELKLEKGMLGTTFGGGQLACAAAISVLEVMKKENLLVRAAIEGGYLKEEIAKLDHVKSVRGRGLMLGIDFDISGKEVRQELINSNGYVTGFSGPDTLRILPPLSINKSDSDGFLKALELSIKAVVEKQKVLQ